MKICVGICTVMLIVASTCVTIAALFPPKEYKGDGRVGGGQGDESIEDV